MQQQRLTALTIGSLLLMVGSLSIEFRGVSRIASFCKRKLCGHSSKCLLFGVLSDGRSVSGPVQSVTDSAYAAGAQCQRLGFVRGNAEVNNTSGQSVGSGAVTRDGAM